MLSLNCINRIYEEFDGDDYLISVNSNTGSKMYKYETNN